MKNRIAKKVILIGWSTADWKMIDPMISRGVMPNIKKLIKNSGKGLTLSPDPPLHTSSWTTMITAMGADKHTISRHVNIEGETFYPVGTHDRQARSIWSILSEHDLKCHQVGCVGTHPADKDINGISLSEFYPISSHKTIYPITKSEIFDSLRVKPEDVTDAELSKFVPDFKSISAGSQEDLRLNLVRKYIAQSRTIYNATEYILKNEEWDFIASFFNAMMWVNHEFALCYVNKGKSKNGPQDELFSNVVPAAFGLLDKLLGKMLGLIKEEYHLILVSEKGFKPHGKWIEEIKRTGKTVEYKQEGIMLIKGEHYSPLNKLQNSSLFDILPTITTLFGLPFSKEFVSSKIIISQGVLKEKMDVKESWGPLRLEAEKVSESIDEETRSEAIEILKLISYLDDDSTVSAIQDNHKYFDARVKISLNLHSEAVPILNSLFKKNIKSSWYAGRLAGCYLATQQEEEFLEILNHALDLGEEIPELHMMKANYLTVRQKYRSASKEMEIAGKNELELPLVHFQIARIYDSMHERVRAESHFTKELLINPNPDAQFNTASFYLKHKSFAKAATHFKKVLEELPEHGTSLAHLGICLYHTKNYGESAEVLEKAKLRVADQKLQTEIQQKLVDIYANQEKKPEKLQEMRKQYEDSIGALGEITIVSGLPRSGTSMLMQMLKEGGMEVFTDGEREADENNKKGYYEHDAVKNIAKDKKFLPQIGDKAVKIISHLLHHLPHVYKYKIVFMDREIEEVMNSQHKMLGRLGKARGESEEHSLKLQKPFAKSRKNAMQWCKRQKKFVDLLLVPYNEVIEDPLVQAKKINEFLGGKLNVKKMASVVDPTLYREKV